MTIHRERGSVQPALCRWCGGKLIGEIAEKYGLGDSANPSLLRRLAATLGEEAEALKKALDEYAELPQPQSLSS